MTDPTQLELLAAANQRLVRVVDALDDATFATPSLLPDWTVGHVVAHLALNGEAVTMMLGQIHATILGQPTDNGFRAGAARVLPTARVPAGGA